MAARRQRADVRVAGYRGWFAGDQNAPDAGTGKGPSVIRRVA